MTPTASRGEYVGLFNSLGEAIEFENHVLGSAGLPPFAQVVKDGEEGSSEYWEWLIHQMGPEDDYTSR